MSDTDLCVARTVSRLAEANGLSLKRLAEKVHMPYRTVQNYLTGDVKIPSEFIAQCCRIFAVEADYLLFNTVALEQMALVTTVHGILKHILPEVDISADGLRLKTSNSQVFDDPAAREMHESAKLREVSAAVSNGYIRHRMADLSNADDSGGAPGTKRPAAS